MNGGTIEYFTDRDAAQKRYGEIKRRLSAPHDLGSGLAWYDGVILVRADGCDDIDDLAEAVNTAVFTDIEDTAIGSEREEI